MADSQVPWGVGALGGAVTEPAWRTKPSWYLAATEDRMIPPPAQHAMAEKAGATLSEVAASHSVYLSQPEAVAPLIAQAAAGAAEPETPPSRLPRPWPQRLGPAPVTGCAFKPGTTTPPRPDPPPPRPPPPP